MIREILKNITGKKQAARFPEGFSAFPEDAVRSAALRERIDAVFARSLRIRQVDAGSCNACEWECTALTNPLYDIQRFGIDFVASPRHADALLVSGPVSRQMELALRKTYLATPEPRLVFACGDCAVDGGIYKGAYGVTNGVTAVVPVDGFIHGCPPSPAAIVAGIIQLLEKVIRKE